MRQDHARGRIRDERPEGRTGVELLPIDVCATMSRRYSGGRRSETAWAPAEWFSAPGWSPLAADGCEFSSLRCLMRGPP